MLGVPSPPPPLSAFGRVCRLGLNVLHLLRVAACCLDCYQQGVQEEANETRVALHSEAFCGHENVGATEVH